MNADPARQRPLDDVGRQEAAALADVLAAEPIEVCLVSEFSRTAQTAELALGGRGVAARVIPALNEVRCGDYFEGRAHSEYFSWCLRHGLFTEPPGAGGDYLADTLLRVHGAWQAVVQMPEETGLVVTHGFLVSFALRMPELIAGEPLFPLPDAHPAGLHKLDAVRLASGLAQIPERVRAAARADEAGRRWAKLRELR